VSEESIKNTHLESAPLLLDGIRIIFVLAVLEMGGAERQALLLARHLVEQQNAKVEFWGLEGEPGRLADICADRGIPWRIAPFSWCTNRRNRVAGLVRLARALRDAQADILLPYLITPNVACGFVWKWTGARVCVWNQRDNGIARLSSKFENWAVKRTPWFISNSEAGAEFLIGDLGARRDRVRVVHNGIELAPAQADRRVWRQRLEITPECFVATMVANLTQYKDHATLLRAWRRVVDSLAQRGQSAALLLAGGLNSGDSTHHLVKALAYDLELGKSVRFLGNTDDVSGLLSASDLGVFSSRSESSPNGVLESMAAGLAIAGTDNSGIRAAVGPSGSEFLAPQSDADALADSILRLANQPDLRARLGQANRQRIHDDFSPQRMFAQTVAVMTEALQTEPN
jgi:glycosyltransferase involved in cell wall biosynthesis